MGYRLRADILTNIMMESYLGPLYPAYTRGLGASQTTYRLQGFRLGTAPTQ